MARKRGGRGSGARASTASRLLLFSALAAAAAFAVLGGEYSTFDLLRQRRERARLEASVDSLQRLVDSLRTYRRRLRTDPALQERLAREEFGMVRGEKELLYRLAPAAVVDSARRRP
ncbi:MAG TPA: septum formation initiator family protein [Gemmatimonadaceae bacterium]|nr:septum formation initiator family protein [Gemmatimonadaceae bacterium]